MSATPPTPPKKPTDPSLDAYNTVADTVGMVPNIRAKDNIVQAIAGVMCAAVGAVVGYVLGQEVIFALLGGVTGLIVGVILTGLVLMVLGWVRTAKKIRS